ncbi:uncharacterized protein LOC120310227 isoform X1 [Crotalus tigris]|uniref:uncharacterized protein LOC120310227 isoform X1 n=1 Tax=Crotalus tigris TaxID=88082 RepID=UPI00192FAF8F|nr:uncharacterized protein LOC120310227 isoform X1 [Crotalus tigris]
MGSVGVPLLLLMGALARISGSEGGKETPAHFLYQTKHECHFLNGTRRVRFLDRYFYDREEYLRFDSARGEFEAVTALGKVDAETFNRDKHKLQFRKAQVDRFCRSNYEVAQSNSVVGRRAGSHFPQHHPPLHREGLLPHGDRGPVAEEWATGGGRGLRGGAPEWRLDLPAPGDAGDPAPAGGCLCLPGGACQPGDPHHHPVGAPFLQLGQEQTLDGDRGSRDRGDLLCHGALPPSEEHECNSHPASCSTHELILLFFLIPDGKGFFFSVTDEYLVFLQPLKNGGSRF